MRKNIKNEKVVRAIAVGIASMMAMNPVTVLAAETPETPADSVSATPIVMPTEIPSISVTPATPIITPAPSTEGEENDSQLSNAKKEIKEAAAAVGDVKSPVLQIPLQGPAQGAVIVAGGYVDLAKKELTEDDKVIDKLLDKSVEGQEDLGYQGSLSDDTATADMDDVESALGRYDDLDIDETIEAATSDLESAGTSAEARQIAANLAKASTDATTELEAAEEALINAYGDLKAAEADYEKALGISDKAVEDAQAAIDKAKLKVEDAESRVNKAKNRVDKIDELLDGIQAVIDNANANLEQEISNAKEDLVVVENRLKEDVKELKDATYGKDGLVDKANAFAEQVGLLGDAITAFTNAINDASTTEAQLKELRTKYEEAKKAYENAKKDYDDAVEELKKYPEVTESQVKELEGLSNEADTVASTALGLIEAYEDAKYEQDLAAALEKVNSSEDEIKDYSEIGGIVINKYLANGKTVIWVPGNIGVDGELLEGVTETPYGKSVDGFYVLISEEDGEEVVSGRYGISVKDGVLTVVGIEAEDTTNFYKVNGKNLPICYDANKQPYVVLNGNNVYIKGNDNDKYYESEIENKNANDTTKLPTVTFEMKSDGRGKEIFVFSENDFNTDIQGYIFSYGDPIRLSYALIRKGNTYEVKTVSNVHVLNPFDHTYYVVGNVLGTISTSINYVQKPQVVVAGEKYDVENKDSSNPYYVDNQGNQHKLVASVDSDGKIVYKVKNSVEYVSGGDANTVYSLGDSTEYTSDKYANELQDLKDAYYGNEEKGILGALEAQKTANTNYNNAKEAYEDYQSALSDMYDKLAFKNDKEKEYKENDLVTGYEINVFGHQAGTSVDLAALPVDLGDLISIEKIMNMESTERDAFIKAIGDVVTGKVQITDLTAFVKTFDMLGMPSIFTIGEVIGIANTPDSFLKVGNITPYEKQYAKAWVDAWMAKLNVVVTGTQMVVQAGSTASAGFELIKAGVNEADKASAVTLDALEVAIRAAAIGGMQLGSDVLVFASDIVGEFDELVEKVQGELEDAQKEVGEAKAALALLNLRNPKASELAMAEEAIKEAEARYANLMKQFVEASKERDRAKELAKEAEELAKKLADEEARRAQASGSGDEYRGGRSEGGMIENAVLYTEDDIALFAQRIADQAVLGARRNARRVAAADTENASGVAGVRVDKNNTDDTKPVVREKEEVKSESVKIVDEETPLAAAPIDEKNMNWWWLIVVALLGATGYELYRKHEEKKQAEGNIADSLKKEN